LGSIRERQPDSSGKRFNGVQRFLQLLFCHLQVIE
jgi:hypothetical protein